METKTYDKFGKAQLRVSKIKRFYNHVGIFIVLNGTLLLLKDKMAVAIFGENALEHPEFMSWVYWNIGVWLVILVVHAIIVFGKIPRFMKKWEERQIKKYMKEIKESDTFE